jgi:hypothetical protein
MPRLSLSPDAVFYVRAVMLGAGVAALAVTWDRWYIRRCLIREFVRQLKVERDFGRRL